MFILYSSLTYCISIFRKKYYINFLQCNLLTGAESAVRIRPGFLSLKLH
ncbi:hypothetical protein LEP1GSC087_0125 [Leptospira interrogans serovar Bataviae str. L1111]|nr:hypothetical protein LEP1GSC087_0125 [Leptospira interrogans serovar Bataviae str. L1111]